MGLDLADLRRGTREGIGLPGDDIVNLPDTDTDEKTGADTYLNRAYWELLDKYKFREKETDSTIETVDGTEEYSVPTPFEAVQSVAFVDPDTLQHTPLDKIDVDEYEQLKVEASETDARSRPTKYFRKGNKIRLYPVPDDVYTLVIHRWTLLSDLSGSATEPDLPRNWHEIILFGGIWRAFIGVNGDYIQAQAAKAHQISLIEGTEATEDKEKFDTHRAGVDVIGYDENNL